MTELATAKCRVCGDTVTMLEAPLHAEDHAQAGEYPPPTWGGLVESAANCAYCAACPSIPCALHR